MTPCVHLRIPTPLTLAILTVGLMFEGCGGPSYILILPPSKQHMELPTVRSDLRQISKIGSRSDYSNVIWVNLVGEIETRSRIRPQSWAHGPILLYIDARASWERARYPIFLAYNNGIASFDIVVRTEKGEKRCFRYAPLCYMTTVAVVEISRCAGGIVLTGLRVDPDGEKPMPKPWVVMYSPTNEQEGTPVPSSDMAKKFCIELKSFVSGEQEEGSASGERAEKEPITVIISPARDVLWRDIVFLLQVFLEQGGTDVIISEK